MNKRNDHFEEFKIFYIREIILREFNNIKNYIYITWVVFYKQNSVDCRVISLFHDYANLVPCLSFMSFISVCIIFVIEFPDLGWGSFYCGRKQKFLILNISLMTSIKGRWPKKIQTMSLTMFMDNMVNYLILLRRGMLMFKIHMMKNFLYLKQSLFLFHYKR